MSRRRLGSIALASVALGLLILSCRQDKSTGPPTTTELDSPYLLGATTGSQNYIHTFANAGTYPYHCKLHTTATHRMAGTGFGNAQAPGNGLLPIFPVAPPSARPHRRGHQRGRGRGVAACD